MNIITMEEIQDIMANQITYRDSQLQSGKRNKLFSSLALIALLAGLMPAFTVRAQSNCQTFTQTGKSVCDRFLEYWNQSGGIAQQGYPLTDVANEKNDTDGKTYATQYFERAVFEMHPENQKPYDVLLSLLGVFQYKQRYSTAGAPGQAASADNPLLFKETGKVVGGKFRTYWEGHGGLAQQGYPISNEFQEKNALDGKTYTVQYFQRAVFELHPENQAPFDVLLSQLGKFRLDAKTKVNYPGVTANVTLNGAGATFPLPYISKWASEYNKLHSGIKVNYQGIGSGGGKKAITDKTVDFAGSDSPMNDTEWGNAGGSNQVMHVPWVMGGIVVSYNVPGVSAKLRLDGATIANIYELNVKSWNDPAIAALNPGVTLPNTPIVVVHRSEGSGTTDNFTNYLSKVSNDWKTKVGSGTVVQWPGGIGAQGNDGVTQIVKQTVGAVGYVELSFARTNNLAYALVKNRAGNFMDATPDNVSAAADSLINSSIPADLRYYITDAPGTNAYPIAATSWALMYVNPSDATKGKAVAYFAWWATHDGQQYADALGYAPLPKSIVERSEAQILRMTCGGGKCFP
jgi:phosphate transport system substrate-binding protein